MTQAEFSEKIYQLMLANRREVGGYQFTIPSEDNYPHQWLWDSCFHSIILSYFDLDAAKKELLSLVSAQFENGMIPHIIFWEGVTPVGKSRVLIDWGKKGTSSITQPPMLAHAVLHIYQKEKQRDFLNQIYPSMARFYKYLLTDRDPRGNHLVGIINPDESGEDNSPRFDEPLGLPSQHDIDVNFGSRVDLINKNKSCNFEVGYCMRNFFWVKDVPFNAIMIENLHALSKIASVLSFSGDATYFDSQALQVADAMRKRMLEDGLYWSTYGLDYKKLKVKTWAIFAPLFAKILDDKEAEALVKKYLMDDRYFNLPYLVPTVSRDEPSYDPKGFWRGPVWIATNWFIYKGLVNYGYSDLAKTILDKSVALIEKSGFREQFNPETGEGMGAYNFTWGGLVLDMN